MKRGIIKYTEIKTDDVKDFIKLLESYTRETGDNEYLYEVIDGAIQISEDELSKINKHRFIQNLKK